MKDLIILKGNDDSGKTTSLQILRDKFGGGQRTRIFDYRGKRIEIRSSSIHETRNPERVINGILNSKSDIIVIACWSDDIVHRSTRIRRTLEEILEERAPGEFQFHVFHTVESESAAQQVSNNRNTAQELKDFIDSLI